MSEEKQSETARSCPRCDGETLGPGELDGLDPQLEAWTCPSCKGHFLSPVAFRDIEVTTFPRLIERRQIPGLEEQLQLLACPVCASKPWMEKFRHPKDRQVVVDRCRDCAGIWLDPGEARAIREESLPVFLTQTARYFIELLD